MSKKKKSNDYIPILMVLLLILTLFSFFSGFYICDKVSSRQVQSSTPRIQLIPKINKSQTMDEPNQMTAMFNL